MTHLYYFLNVLFKSKAASTNYRLDQPGTPADSGVRKPGYAGFHDSPPSRPRITVNHELVVLMKSQIG